MTQYLSKVTRNSLETGSDRKVTRSDQQHITDSDQQFIESEDKGECVLLPPILLLNNIENGVFRSLSINFRSGNFG